ncbi:MAG TPA: hypothetical protein VMY05_11435 [Acidobacteriota bacterium]|nr:hypothetical protein [Acidobacteriota bacterium]
MKADIWKWFGNEYKVHCERREDYKTILSWPGCRWGGDYYHPDGHVEFDVIIPARHRNAAVRLLGLRPKNSEKSSVVAQQVTEGPFQN